MIDLCQSSVEVAKQLLGCQLIRYIADRKLSGMIVETEAYDQFDAASHSFRGRTPRVDVMFGPAGRAYVYFTYGMHYCFNIVTGSKNHGSAVLVRALEPLDGLDLMAKNRGPTFQKLYSKRDDRHKIDTISHELTNGPAKLCNALKIDKAFNGHNLRKKPLLLMPGREIADRQIIKTTRIGISKDTHREWRYFIKDNPFVSKH